MAHVKIELRDARRGLVRSAESDSAGYYAISSVPAATYNLSAKINLFLPFELQQLKLEEGTSRRLDITMSVAGVDTVAEVADAVGLRLESAEGGRTLDETRIQSLPLNRRDFLQLALLASGVASPVEDRKSTRLNSSHLRLSRMPSSA